MTIATHDINLISEAKPTGPGPPGLRQALKGVSMHQLHSFAFDLSARLGLQAWG
jgi:hypothetical protein